MKLIVENTALFVNPNDFDGAEDNIRIQKAVDSAKKFGINKVLIPGLNKARQSFEWIIEDTILLPSDITLVLDNCTLKMADNVMCQMFRNERALEEAGKTLEGEQRNIYIYGRGRALLDGGKDNGFCEKNSLEGLNPHVYHNILLYFHNVANFVVEGITVRDQRYWAMCFAYCNSGRISNINFELTVHHSRFGKMTWRNQDGIDLRLGCHNITIENIYGETGDDTIAMTALGGPKSFDNLWRVDGKEPHIHNITVRNVKTTTNLCANVRLLNHNRNRIYNIVLDNISDDWTTEGDYKSAAVIKIGENGYFGDNPENRVKPGETYGISVSNVFSRAKTAVQLNSVVSEVGISNVFVREGGEYSLSTCKIVRGEFVIKDGDADATSLENIFVNGVFHPGDTPPFYFYKLNAKNFIIRGLFSKAGVIDGFSGTNGWEFGVTIEK